MNPELLLALGAQPRSAGAHEPLELAPAEAAWVVSRGRFELFAVETLAGADDVEPERRRLHLGTKTRGDLLLGLALAPGSKLLAVGSPGSELLVSDLGALRRLAREAERIPELAGALERWIGGLLSPARRQPAPRVLSPLPPGSEVALTAAGDAVHPSGGVVWVRHLAGKSHLLGRPDLVLDSGSELFPLPQESWLTAVGELRLSGVATELLLRSGVLWDALDSYHRLARAYLQQELAALAAGERSRLSRRGELETRTTALARLRLSSVLTRSRATAPSVVLEEEPLLAASRLVGEHLSLSLAAPAGAGGGSVAQRLERICSISHVKARRVLLRDDWWRRDGGPLLAFRRGPGEGQPSQPVALLPRSPRLYELVVPGTGGRSAAAPVAVDQEVASTVEPEAFQMYRSLPDRPVGKLDLLRHAYAGRRDDLLRLAFAGAGGGLLGILVPVISGQLFGSVIPGADRQQLVQMTLALVVAALAAAGFQLVRSIAVLRLGGKIDGVLQAAVWDRLLSLPAAFFRNFTVGDLVSRASGIDTLREILVGNFTTTLLTTFFSLASYALLFYYSWRLALTATAIVALLGLVTGLLSYLQIRRQRTVLALQGEISSLLIGFFNGIAKLRAGGAEARAFGVWAARFAEQRKKTIEARRIANLQGVVNVLFAILSALALFAMVSLAGEENLPASEFLAFNVAFGQFQAAALSFLGMLSSALTLVPVYERLTPILTERPEVDATKPTAGELRGEVEVSHVSFRYQADGPVILDDVSLRVRPGEFVALVGPSGSGKSTLLRLLLGFETPRSGTVYFDGQDLSSLDVASVRRQLGVVLQHGQLMAGDLYSNIVGSFNLGLDAAWLAARLAGLEADIRAMPMGMHTVVSEGAGTFSGGQKQRVLIARALVSRPRILLLDEATSALDNRTQGEVSQSLDALRVTRIVVAHRLSTIQNADRIYVLDRGRIVEQGVYRELLERGGTFTRLAERQLS